MKNKKTETIGAEAIRRKMYTQKTLDCYWVVQNANRKISRERKALVTKKLSTIAKVDKRGR